MNDTDVRIPGTANFREVRATVADGYRLRPGYLFRSDALSRLGREGRAALTALGIRRVVDLRSDRDRRLGGRDRLGGDVEVVRVPMLGGSAASFLGSWELRDVYREILVGHGPEVRAAVRAVAGSPGPVVVHCTAGKDRTGVVVALALLAAGVDREAVIEDYARTESNLAGEWLEEMVALVGRYGVPDSPELRVLMGGSPREAIEGVLETIERDHGSTREYLLAAGLSLHDLAALERLLIDAA
ncbi:MAG: tyrosine-protein phosphatase [Cellulomonas sp.]